MRNANPVVNLHTTHPSLNHCSLIHCVASTQQTQLRKRLTESGEARTSLVCCNLQFSKKWTDLILLNFVWDTAPALILTVSRRKLVEQDRQHGVTYFSDSVRWKSWVEFSPLIWECVQRF